MLVLYYEADERIFRGRFGNVENLDDLRELIMHGEDIQILDAQSNNDITRNILLQIITDDLRWRATDVKLDRGLHELIRSNSATFRKPGQRDLDHTIDIPTLVAWIGISTKIVNTLLLNFGRRYLPFDYSYLMGTVALQNMKGESIDIESALASTPYGSRKTKSERLKQLVDDGWITQSHDTKDRRRVVIQTTTLFNRTIRSFAAGILVDWLQEMQKFVDYRTNVDSVVNILQNNNDGSIDNSHLLPWVECLVESSQSWVRHFGKEFSRVEYVILYTNVVVAHWKNEPLVFNKLEELLKLGSPRTHKSRISKAVEFGLIRRSNLEEDKRVSVYLPTPKLTHLIELHYRKTLSDFLSCIEKLPV